MSGEEHFVEIIVSTMRCRGFALTICDDCHQHRACFRINSETWVCAECGVDRQVARERTFRPVSDEVVATIKEQLKGKGVS